MVTSTLNGRKITYINNEWIYDDTKKPIEEPVIQIVSIGKSVRI